MELTSLKRLDQIAKHIFKEEMLQYLNSDTELKNVKIKLQKYYVEIDNHTEFDKQAPLTRAMTLFLSKYQENKTACYFDMDVRIYSQWTCAAANNFRKLSYPDGKAGY